MKEYSTPPGSGRRWTYPAFGLYLVLIAVNLAGCSGTSYRPADIGEAAFLQRAVSQEQASVRITAAVPDAAEATASGAAGGVVQVSSVTPTLTATPTVSTTVNDLARLTAIRNIDYRNL